jgi:hypothetical protein
VIGNISDAVKGLGERVPRGSDVRALMGQDGSPETAPVVNSCTKTIVPSA